MVYQRHQWILAGELRKNLYPRYSTTHARAFGRHRDNIVCLSLFRPEDLSSIFALEQRTCPSWMFYAKYLTARIALSFIIFIHSIWVNDAFFQYNCALMATVGAMFIRKISHIDISWMLQRYSNINLIKHIKYARPRGVLHYMSQVPKRNHQLLYRHRLCANPRFQLDLLELRHYPNTWKASLLSV